MAAATGHMTSTTLRKRTQFCKDMSMAAVLAAASEITASPMVE
jgi:hypothetical protein